MALSGIAVSDILLLKRLGFRVAVFSLLRRGHTFVTQKKRPQIGHKFAFFSRLP